MTVAECDALLDHARALERALTAERAARERAEANLLCPGQMRCAKCKFELTRRTLFVQSGTVGAGSSETEPCPNGCGPLWPVTWEQEARACYAAMDRLFDEKQRAEAERNALRAEVERLREDAERLAWLEKLFERKWDGTLGRPWRGVSWYLAGPYRHVVQTMRGETFREAIDTARKESGNEA